MMSGDIERRRRLRCFDGEFPGIDALLQRETERSDLLLRSAGGRGHAFASSDSTLKGAAEGEGPRGRLTAAVSGSRKGFDLLLLLIKADRAAAPLM